jgi:DMSO/TMAO reductase YedYZ molybdopterin-dependent catalytic subunit/thiosulfate reductase cytochrome b subunit
MSVVSHLDAAERAVHYPLDRRHRVIVRPRALIVAAVLLLVPLAAAWLQFLVAGLPVDPGLRGAVVPAEASGFPAWLCVSHWANFFFMAMLMRSGLSILMDHPRLYWSDHCTPNTEWIRFTPLTVPRDRVWQAKDDARYISPLLGLPGYRHTIGIARVWHFFTVPFYVLNGVAFTALLLLTPQWQKLVPNSLQIVPEAWSVFVYYATLHLPTEPNGFYAFNPLQQLSYFVVTFMMAPFSVFTGLAMSPAIENRFPWYCRLFGGRQAARSLHFLLMLGYIGFIFVHVSMVVMTGFVRNMNHITRGADDTSPAGALIGLAIVGGTIAFWFMAHWISWNRPRALQHASLATEAFARTLSLNAFKPRAHFTKKDISPFMWPNGKMPVSEEWKQLAENRFRDFKLKISGLVENPIELSLDDLKALGKEESITMHHCIQGWSGIAQWGGVSMAKIVALVKPKSAAATVAFYSFGEGLYGGEYYDTHTLENVLKPQCILAWEMNYQSLPELYGAPLRLRVENQLGYKMVKWIRSIEFVESYKSIGKGEGGKNEDDEYFDLLANI